MVSALYHNMCLFLHHKRQKLYTYIICNPVPDCESDREFIPLYSPIATRFSNPWKSLYLCTGKDDSILFFTKCAGGYRLIDKITPTTNKMRPSTHPHHVSVKKTIQNALLTRRFKHDKQESAAFLELLEAL